MSKGPMIAIDLMKGVTDSEFLYSTPPKNLIQMNLMNFDRVLDEMTKIPDIEHKILQEVFKLPMRNETYIKTQLRPRTEPIIRADDHPTVKYSHHNKWLWDLYVDIQELLERAIEPLKAY